MFFIWVLEGYLLDPDIYKRELDHLYLSLNLGAFHSRTQVLGPVAKGQGWGPSVALHDGAEVVSGDFWISQESVNLWDGRKLFFCPSSLCPSYRWVAECRGSVCLDRDGMLAEVLSRALSAGALPRHHRVPPVGGVGQGEPLRVFEESTSHLLRLCKLPSLAYSL